jgi:hypothetical protein
MGETLVIGHRFCGPPTSGNGGWVSGSLAGFVEGPAEVTLRQPPPLGTPLEVVHDEDGGVRLLDGDELVAEARPRSVDDELDWPLPVTIEEAREAEERYLGHHHHAFPTCFTCGTGRDEDDGLRIFPGPVEGRPGTVACTWTPTRTTASEAGTTVTGPITWAAVDCPSAWPFLGEGTVALLGRMTASIDRPPVVGETYVVVGEAAGEDGRKRFGRAALYTPLGEPVAVSRATWITVEDT